MRELIQELQSLIESARIFKDNGQDVDADIIDTYIEPKVIFYNNFSKTFKPLTNSDFLVLENITNDLGDLRDILYNCIDDVSYFDSLHESGEIQDLPQLPQDQNGNFINVMNDPNATYN